MKTDLTDVFFNLREFAEPVKIYHSELGAWSDYKGLFEDPSTTARIDEASISEWTPQIMLSEKHLAKRILKADRAIVRGVQYVIESVDYDGFGVVTDYLRRR